MFDRNSLRLLVQFKIQKEEIIMNQYQTPLKDQSVNSQRQPKTLTQSREGDWVCYNCNNLNFSFRKKCNRCKIQTRQQNQQVSAYYSDYLPINYYFESEKQNFPSLHTPISASPSAQKTSSEKNTLHSICQDFNRLEQTPEKIEREERLPSVSPLVKRYNRHENNSTQESKNGGLFENETIWANINLHYLDEPRKADDSEENDQKWQMHEIQKIIQKIML